MLRAKKNATPSVSTRQSSAPTRSGVPSPGNDLQPHYGPGAKSCSGHDFRAVIANVHDLAGVALCPRFDDHRPGDSGSRMLPPISKVLTDHGLTRGNWRARTGNVVNMAT